MTTFRFSFCDASFAETTEPFKQTVTGFGLALESKTQFEKKGEINRRADG